MLPLNSRWYMKKAVRAAYRDVSTLLIKKSLGYALIWIIKFLLNVAFNVFRFIIPPLMNLINRIAKQNYPVFLAEVL
jgi:hypothetical protein